MPSTRHLLLPIVLSCAALLVGCPEGYDFERKSQPRESFGAEVHQILQRDLERSPDDASRRSAAFAARRDGFVGAVDATLPEPLLDPMNQTMIRMMPLYDDGTVPDLMRKVAILLEEAQTDPALLDALARLANRPDVIGDPSRDRLLAHVLRFPEMGATNEMLAELLLSHDGRGADFAVDDSESNAAIELILALSIAMRESEVDTDPTRFTATLADVLLSEDAAFGPAVAADPLWVVRVDDRGLPRVAGNDLSRVPSPFVDIDGDGLADVDATTQRFVGADGAPMLDATPFGAATPASMSRDAEGRLLNAATGGFAFEYVDLHRTALGFLGRESAGLVERDVPFDLLRSLKVALGDVQIYQDEYGVFDGYQSDSELVALTHGLLVALDHEDVPAVLEGLAMLMREHPDELASVLDALDQASEIADRYDTDFADDSTLIDDLLPLVREIVETPGLLEDVLVALDDPVAAQMGESLATLIQYKNDFITIEKGGAYDACFLECRDTLEMGTVDRWSCIRACPNGEIFAAEVDRFAPEGPSNLSLFQRLNHLLYETAAVPYPAGITSLSIGNQSFDNTAQALGPAMTFDDLAEAYLLTTIGALDLADTINPSVIDLGSPLGLGGETVVDIVVYITGVCDLEMQRFPSTDQVTRLFNKYPLAGTNEDGVSAELNASVCKSGHLCIDSHADTLIAIEASGMADTLVPLVEAFHAHGKTDLLARLLAQVYLHYPGPGIEQLDAAGDPLPLANSNIRSLEPMLQAILTETDLLPSLGAQGPILAGLTLGDGSRFVPALERHLTWLLTPAGGVALFDGSTSATDLRGRRIEPLAPVYVALDPFRGLDALLAADPEAEAAFERAIEGAADVMLETTDGPSGPVFARPGGPVLAATVLDEFREAWLEEDAAGTRSEWLRQDVTDDLADVLTGRALFAGVQLFDWIDADAERVALMQRMMLHTMELGNAAPELMPIFLYALVAAALDTEAGVPVSHFLGQAIDPRRTWEVETYPSMSLAIHGVWMLDKLSPLDPDQAMLDVMANAMDGNRAGTGSNAGAIWAVVRDVNRTEPGAETPLSGDDYGRIMGVTAEFLRDDQRGLERLYDFIEYAMWGPNGKPQEAQ